MKTIERKLTTVYVPSSQPGFLGKGHTARPVVAVDFSQSDPFIMLMDDWLDKTDNVPVGGPHPHAGFETVTLVLQGEIGEGPNTLREGDFEMMTAGSGIVHTETIAKPSKMRILQLWLNLPKKDRQATPRIQRLSAAHVPGATRNGADIRVYSGTFAGLTSPIQNHTPLIVADIRLQPHARLTEGLPANFSTLMYVTEGSVQQVGEGGRVLDADHVGWLDRSDDAGESQVLFAAGEDGARFLLYSAEPQHHEIVAHGPFIADSMEDIRQLYADYRAGKMGHIREVAAEHQLVY